jgi:hypothetical protein
MALERIRAAFSIATWHRLKCECVDGWAACASASFFACALASDTII